MVLKLNNKVWADIEEAAKNGVSDGTNLVYDEILSLVLSTPKSGRLYSFRGGVHQASAPGEPFANMTGNALLQTKVTEEDSGLTGVITGHADYAAYLELGTGKMAARPVFRPALANKADEFVKAVYNEIGKALKKS